MFRSICSALLLAMMLLPAGCGEGATEASFMSEAAAASTQVPDYGWRPNAEPKWSNEVVTEYQ